MTVAFLSPHEIAALDAARAGLRQSGQIWRGAAAAGVKVSRNIVLALIDIGLVERPAMGRATIFATETGRRALELHQARPGRAKAIEVRRVSGGPGQTERVAS